MITFNASYHFRIRGIKRTFTFLRKLGFSHNLAHRLAVDDTKSIRFDHLEKLCIALNCTPNDLLLWHEEGQGLPKEHPLRQLEKAPPELEIADRLKTLPLETLEQINRLIEEKEANG